MPYFMVKQYIYLITHSEHKHSATSQLNLYVDISLLICCLTVMLAQKRLNADVSWCLTAYDSQICCLLLKNVPTNFFYPLSF